MNEFADAWNENPPAEFHRGNAMTNQQNRILLAEAMNLDGLAHGDIFLHKVDDSGALNFFDPFTDANDDYAVLEWMLGHEDYDLRRRFIIRAARMTKNKEGYDGVTNYRKGIFARAALKVLEGGK